MELMLRCALSDQPGALAQLAAAISAVGGDIQAVEVVEHDGGRALDDFEIVLADDRIPALLDRVSSVEGVQVIHAGPSRGQPGDAVTRMSIGIQSLLDGSAEPRRGIATLIGGMLRARRADFMHRDDAPADGDRVLVLDAGDVVLVLHRDYRFTPNERARGAILLRLAQRAVAPGDAALRSH